MVMLGLELKISRMAAGVEHVVVAGQRPVAGARGEFPPTRFVERDRSLPAQGGESAVADVVVETQKSQVPRSMSESGTSGGAAPFTRVAMPTPRVYG